MIEIVFAYIYGGIAASVFESLRKKEGVTGWFWNVFLAIVSLMWPVMILVSLAEKGGRRGS